MGIFDSSIFDPDVFDTDSPPLPAAENIPGLWQRIMVAGQYRASPLVVGQYGRPVIPGRWRVAP